MSTRTADRVDWPSTPFDQLPLTHSISVYVLASLLLVALTAFVTIVGLTSQVTTYPTEEARIAFVATDALTLFVGLPLLLITLWLTSRGSLVGLLCWPGMLVYLTYTYIPYLLDAPFSAYFLAYLLLVILSGYSFVGMIAAIDSHVVKRQLDKFVPARLGAGVLILLGTFFLLNIITNTINALDDPNLMQTSLWIADAVMAPMLVFGGVLLWRRQALGYTMGSSLLLLVTVLALGVIPVVIHQDVVQGDPFDAVSFIVLLIMGLLCLIPFLLFIRGINRTQTDQAH